MELISENRSFGGRQLRYRHHSNVLECEMFFSVYLPPQAEQTSVPILYWLSGLTCTDENFVQKAGAQRYASELGVAIVAPDTSPRGEQIPDDPDGAYDFGLGAGFYLNATEPPFNKNYRMYDYVVQELPALVQQHFPVIAEKQGIFGHSMGGHGALTIALKHSNIFKSASAFSPISAPTQCPWGQKALSGYLGNDQNTWQQYDTVSLLATTETRTPLLVDQGDADNFLEEQLKPELLQAACDAINYPLQLRMQPGYDHSYFFIASFIGEHIRWHKEQLDKA
ncbi:S-formylglutathione hydrolase [Porticoccaceae bacterium LTM1]|nr:S-formylglutathione hydrolase [Porticoccaceae bacterium LTM1]